MPYFFLLFFLYFIPCGAEVKLLQAKVVATHPHSRQNFTQGLVVTDQFIYESCGLYGESSLKKYDLQSKELLAEVKLPARYFAEGIALFNNEIIQLTWKEKKAFVYDAKTLELKKTIHYQGEGWGLCVDNDALWMSNGSAQLFKRDPQTFAIQKVITVHDGKKKYALLNDLVCVGPFLYANVFGKEKILRIDKQDGRLLAVIDCSALFPKSQRKNFSIEAVFNGIAYQDLSGHFFVTGKLWPLQFEITFEKK